jgi:hypothetical protein
VATGECRHIDSYATLFILLIKWGLLRVSNFFTVSTVLPHQLFTYGSDVMSLALRKFSRHQFAVSCVLPGARNGSARNQREDD